MKKLLSIFLFFSLVAAVSSCTDDDIASADGNSSRSLVVLYESDVHCAVDAYPKLAGLRDAISDTADVIVVSSGDFIQGGTIGALSSGKSIIEIMNSVKYDAVTLGNHEFDFGIPHLKQLAGIFNSDIVQANLMDSVGNPLFPAYKIVKAGNRKLGIVGVTTARPMTSISYVFYGDDGKLKYELSNSRMISLVQDAVNQCRKEEVDHVILLSHLGHEKEGDILTSSEVISATTGIDVVLDGHVHEEIEKNVLYNADGNPVYVTEPGIYMSKIGHLLIKDKKLTPSLIDLNYVTRTNTKVQHVVDSIKDLTSSILEEVIGHADQELVVTDASGDEIIRRQETNMGDFITDAFRYVAQSDLGLITSGSCRNSLPAGVVTYGSLLNSFPYDAYLVKAEVTGSQLLDALNDFCASLPSNSSVFPQVSGMRFKAEAGKNPLVTEVEILNNTGTYEPVELDKTYTLGTTSYVLTFPAFKNCKILQNNICPYLDATIRYIKEKLNGNIGEDYKQPYDRFTYE